MNEDPTTIYIPPHRRTSSSPEKKSTFKRGSSPEGGGSKINYYDNKSPRKVNRLSGEPYTGGTLKSPRFEHKNQKSPRKDENVAVTFNTLIEPLPKKIIFIIDIPPMIEPPIVEPPYDNSTKNES
jgi:hypothetical protein